MGNILITLISTIICTIVYVIIYIIFIAIPILGYLDMKDIPESENDYSEWKLFYFIQLIVNSIYVFMPVFLIILSFFANTISTCIGTVIYGLQTLVYLTLGIGGIVLYLFGEKHNIFGKEWNSETLDIIEDSYKCCFS